MLSYHLIFCYPFSYCPQSFPGSGSFPVSCLYTSGGQSVGTSASATILPKNIQNGFPLGLTGLISLQYKGLSRVLSSITIFKASILWHSLDKGLLQKQNTKKLQWLKTTARTHSWGKLWTKPNENKNLTASRSVRRKTKLHTHHQAGGKTTQATLRPNPWTHSSPHSI